MSTTHGTSPQKARAQPLPRTPRLPGLLALVLPCTLAAADPAPAGGPGGDVSARAPPAADRSGAVAPAAVVSSIDAPRLAGRGLLRWFGLRVYEAALWVPASGFDPARPLRTPFALDLRYERSLEGAAIAETSIREMARLGLGTPARREEWRDALRRILPDVRTGDRLTGVHLPGRAVRFFRNDSAIGTIDDPEFGMAFFAIWLDVQTAAPELRGALLRGNPNPGSQGRPP